MGCLRIFVAFFFICSCMVTPALSANGDANQQTGTVVGKPANGQRAITIDFDNVDIRLFIKYISELTGKNFVVDKAVQGNVTILSPTKISDEEAYRVFESVLEVHGFTTIPAGSVIKIVPAATARSRNVETIRRGGESHPEDKIVTQLVPLKHSSPDEIKKVLTPLVSKTSVIVAHSQSGMLILTETLSNIQRLLAIIETLDVEFTEQDVAVLYLENADSETVAKLLTSVYQRTTSIKKGVATRKQVKVVSYDRVNALVVMASNEEIGRIKKLVRKLDTPIERSEGNIHVFYLQNANAVELSKVLNALPEENSKELIKGKAPSISKQVKVTADEETNSLIITASREEYRVLEGVIKKLDIRRQMVYLEALILEVNTDKSFDVGVEWALDGVFESGDGQFSSGFVSDSGSRLINTDATSGALSFASTDGFTFGIMGQGLEIGGIEFPNLAAVVNAFKSDSDINIISTPQILTTDNKKAEISVGENVPYITSERADDATGDAFTQYEYRDVATKLTITPHINQAETMRLEIDTEVVKLKGDNISNTPTTLRRTASTNVIVNDGDTVVIGGIIGEDTNFSEVKIPVLGDIPVLGWLFKSEASQDTQTNMFIFITPRIIRNPADIADVTMQKEKEMGTTMPKAQEVMHYTRANKQHSLGLTEKGFGKLLENKNQEARIYFEEALELDPNNPYALLNMGVVLERQGQHTGAIQYYQRVISTGTTATAIEASDPGKEGLSLVQIARENIERLKASL